MFSEGDNIDEEQNEWILTAAEGNALEAINLAINGTTTKWFNNHFT